MNKNEAIEYLQGRYLAVGSRVNPPKEECERHNEVVDMAIKALEEVQQYRTIGTPEECRAAVEKQKTRKPHKNVEKFGGVWCACGKYLGKEYFVDKPTYCSDCGQKIDWSDEE